MIDSTVIPLPHATRRSTRVELMAGSSRTDAMKIWRNLESDIGSRKLMSSSIWTDTWLTHFGNRIPHQFIVAYHGDSACGICLLTQGVGQHNGPLRTQTWHLGTAGEPESDSVCVEYNSLLARPEDRREFQRQLWKWVVTRSDWDEFHLDGFQEADLKDWLAEDRHWSIHSKPTRYFDLNAARESRKETLALLGNQTRSAIRRNLRRSGTARCEWAETVTQAEDIFAELVKLHQIRWNSIGLPGCYSSRVFREFHLDLLNRLVPIGQMGLFRVRNDHVTIGCDQVLIDNNRACLYQGGRLLPDDHRLSTGVIVDYYLIEECRRRGFDAVDFLAGDSPHKCRLSTHSLPLAWAVYRRPRFKHRIVDSVRYLKRAIERAFTNTPAESRPTK